MTVSTDQVDEAQQAVEEIWGLLRPKEQREHLESYITVRAYFMAALNGAVSETNYEDADLDDS
jgi:hypothetical protein